MQSKKLCEVFCHARFRKHARSSQSLRPLTTLSAISPSQSPLRKDSATERASTAATLIFLYLQKLPEHCELTLTLAQHACPMPCIAKGLHAGLDKDHLSLSQQLMYAQRSMCRSCQIAVFLHAVVIVLMFA